MPAADRRRPQAGGPPVTLWRIVSARHAGSTWSGEGARLWGGRFNHPGTPVVYTASSLSLAVLELLVHTDSDLLPTDLVTASAELPAGIAQRVVAEEELPADWRDYPAPAALRDLGGAWIAARESVALVIPSAVVPGERDVLLDPAHPDFARLRLGPAQPFTLDPRLWRRGR